MKRTAHWQTQSPSPAINKKNIKNRICAAALPAHAQWSYSCPFDLWRVRLVVRTQPSQGWCTGSTPVRAVDFLPLLVHTQSNHSNALRPRESPNKLRVRGRETAPATRLGGRVNRGHLRPAA